MIVFVDAAERGADEVPAATCLQRHAGDKATFSHMGVDMSVDMSVDMCRHVFRHDYGHNKCLLQRACSDVQVAGCV